MLRFILSRLLSMCGVILGVTVLVFLLLHIVPGDPVEALLGETAQAADYTQLRHALGLDLPLWQQWVNYASQLLQGDFGTSLYSKQSINSTLVQRLPQTFYLAITSLVIALVIALPLGTLAALKQYSIWDHGAMVFSLIGVSIPNFWMGPLLIMVFSLSLGWLPVSGQEHSLSIVLPALTLGTALAAILARMVRATLLEVMHEDYIRTARAKGLSQWMVITKHALRNAALPLITIIGLQLGTLLGGAVITEMVFSWPGIGQLTIQAIQQRDYPTVQACVLIISISYVFINALTDIVYAWLDPRVHYRV